MTHNYAYALLATLTYTKMQTVSWEEMIVTLLTLIAYALLARGGH